MPWAGSPKWPNIGITASTDIMEVDQSSLDMISQQSQTELGDDSDIKIQLKTARKIFKASTANYELVRVPLVFTPPSLHRMRKIKETYERRHPVRGLPEFNPRGQQGNP